MARVLGMLVALLLAGCTISFSPSPAQGDVPKPTPGTPAQQTEAVTAARGYLALLDGRDYEQVWALAGPALRDSTNRFVFIQTMKLTAKALPVDHDRRVEGVAFTTRLDASTPVGEYAVVQFLHPAETMRTTERVILQREQARWKIVGYFINKQSFGNKA